MIDPPAKSKKLIDALVARWHGQPMNILRPAFGLFLGGGPVTMTDLSRAAGVREAIVSDAVRGSLATVNAHGAVSELFGVGFAATPHRVVAAGTTLYTCCALVGHALVYLLRVPITLDTVDPVTQARVRLDLNLDGIQGSDPDNPAATLVEVEPEEAIADPGRFVCRHLRQFESRDSASRFAQESNRRFVVSNEEFHSVAKRLCDVLWGP